MTRSRSAGKRPTSGVGDLTPSLPSAPLEQAIGARSLSVVQTTRLGERVRGGLSAGVIAAAATGGVIAGFGVREGSAGEPFAALGRLLLGIATSEPSGRQLVGLIAGIVLHSATALAWGLLFAALFARLRGLRLMAAAALFAAVAYAVSTKLPGLLRLGHGARAFPPQLVLLYTVLAISLVAGIRLARIGGHIGDPAHSR
jgi:hypothetical protein